MKHCLCNIHYARKIYQPIKTVLYMVQVVTICQQHAKRPTTFSVPNTGFKRTCRPGNTGTALPMPWTVHQYFCYKNAVVRVINFPQLALIFRSNPVPFSLSNFLQQRCLVFSSKSTTHLT